MRIAIISDIHANLAAFDAVIADFGAIDRVWCLGDVVGYGPDPNECVERLQELPFLAVVGNHDWAAIGRLDLASFNPVARAAVEWTTAQLRPSVRAFLEGLPLRRIDEGCTITHGSPRDPIWEYLLSAEQAAENFAEMATPICFVGHSHVALAFSGMRGSDGAWHARAHRPLSEPVVLGQQHWIINPGSVGQPRDGNPLAAYLLLDTVSETFQHRRVAYDIGRTQRRMRAAQLPEQLEERLRYGV